MGYCNPKDVRKGTPWAEAVKDPLFVMNSIGASVWIEDAKIMGFDEFYKKILINDPSESLNEKWWKYQWRKIQDLNAPKPRDRFAFLGK